MAQDGSLMAGVGGDGQLHIWDPETYSEIVTIQAHDDEIQGVAFSRDGHLLATAGEDGLAKIWDTATWQPLLTLEAHESLESGFFRGLLTVAFSPDAKLLVTGGVDGAVRIWDVASGILLHDLAGHTDWTLNSIFNPDGTLLVTTGEEINIWDASSGTLLQTLSPDNWLSGNRGFWAAEFSPDGSQLVLGRTDHIMEIWQMPSAPWQPDQDLPDLRLELESGSGFLFNTVYSPEGDMIAVSGLGTLVEVRDADTGDLLLGLQHPAAVRQALFTPDGRSLVTRSFDEVVRVFALDLEDLQALAESRVTRSLTIEECQQYLHSDACPQ
jgi:WD40 repeat protein